MKNIKEMTRGAIWAEGNTLTNLRFQVRNFLRSAVEATYPDLFYFSLNGMVMPLSHKG